MQSSFTAQELGAYLQGTIQIRRETPALTTLPVSFQGSLAITALQRAFPGHYLTASTMPPATTDTALFKLARPPLSTPCLNLARLRRGAGNADPGSDNAADDATNLQPNVCANIAIADTPLTHLADVWSTAPVP